MPRIEHDIPLPKSVRHLGQHHDGPVRVSAPSDAYRNASVWKTCPECGRDFFGDEGVKRHREERGH